MTLNTQYLQLTHVTGPLNRCGLGPVPQRWKLPPPKSLITRLLPFWAMCPSVPSGIRLFEPLVPNLALVDQALPPLPTSQRHFLDNPCGIVTELSSLALAPESGHWGCLQMGIHENGRLGIVKWSSLQVRTPRTVILPSLPLCGPLNRDRWGCPVWRLYRALLAWQQGGLPVSGPKCQAVCSRIRTKPKIAYPGLSGRGAKGYLQFDLVPYFLLLGNDHAITSHNLSARIGFSANPSWVSILPKIVTQAAKPSARIQRARGFSRSVPCAHMGMLSKGSLLTLQCKPQGERLPF